MVDEKVPSIKGTGDGAGRLKSDLNNIFSNRLKIRGCKMHLCARKL
jgi:hypothetical protein